MSSHHYLYHYQNMDPRHPSSKNRESVREVFECTFHGLIACVLSYFFSQLFCLILHFLKTGLLWFNAKMRTAWVSSMKRKSLAPWSSKKGQQLTYRLVQTRVKWSFIKLLFWNFVVSTNCNICYMIKILPKNRYNGLIKLIKCSA